MKSIIGITVLLPIVFMMGASAQETNEAVEIQPAISSSGGLQIEGRTDQERIEFLSRVAAAYFEEGDPANAINAYERILEIDPGNRVTRFTISHVYIMAKRYAEAEALLLELIEEYPDDFTIKNNLAWLYATAEDPSFRKGEEAIRLAQEALAITPNDHHVWSTLAEAYYVTGDYEKAQRAVQHMAKLAMRDSKNITKEIVDGYNSQILKCKRAWDSDKALRGEEEEPAEDSTTEAPDSSVSDDSAQ
jgi:tetratricopeptide (TPR) repeat protein